MLLSFSMRDLRKIIHKKAGGSEKQQSFSIIPYKEALFQILESIPKVERTLLVFRPQASRV